MAERWFFALWPERSVAVRLAALRSAPLNVRERWAHPMDLHLTLAFLGELAAGQLGCVQDAADGVEAPVFMLTLDQVGAFPRNQILWCGSTETPSALLALVETLQVRLVECGITPERRLFRPHVTLARKVRFPHPVLHCDPLPWLAREFVLAFGRGGRAPRYEVWRRWPLIEANVYAGVDGPASKGALSGRLDT
jgi:RNA 2',3'-cyclic 3'-phosphodiesterase